MPTVNLTARNVPRLTANDAPRVEYWDASLTGFGLRVTSTGIRVWTVRYRVLHTRKLVRKDLGRYPNLSLAEARDRARKALHEAGLGHDPREAKRIARQDEVRTVAALVKRYADLASARKGWPEENRIHQNEILPAWGPRSVREITRSVVRALVDAKAKTAPVMANRLLAQVSRLLNEAVNLEWIDANPALRLPRRPEKTRDRVLSSDELAELWKALHETQASREGKPVARLNETMNCAMRTLLLTGQREGEVAAMRWADVDLESGFWTLPGASTKNGSDHRVPLTDTAIELLSGRLQIAKPDAVYVFSTRRDTNVAARMKKAASELSRGLSFSFRAHDLRRTVASGMAEAGIARDHIAHVLNHRSVTRSSITAIYDRYSYDREKRSALATWERVLLSVVNSATRFGRVLPMIERAG